MDEWPLVIADVRKRKNKANPRLALPAEYHYSSTL